MAVSLGAEGLVPIFAHVPTLLPADKAHAPTHQGRAVAEQVMPALISRSGEAGHIAGFEFRIWSEARDLNPGPQSPEPPDFSIQRMPLSGLRSTDDELCEMAKLIDDRTDHQHDGDDSANRHRRPK